MSSISKAKTFLSRVLSGSAEPSPQSPQPKRPKRERPDRKERFTQGENWKHGTLSHRLYESYEHYLQHQRSKLKRIKRGLEAKGPEKIKIFRRRFELAPLKPASSILCLGARLGHEVMAFIELGHFAVGIDLCPGEQNSHVMVGDFHHLVFADQSVDCVYINSLDHIHQLESFVAEVKRVLKPGGLFLADIVYGYEEGFIPGEFEAMHWPTARTFADELARLGNLDIVSSTDLKEVGSPRWVQFVFRSRDQAT